MARSRLAGVALVVALMAAISCGGSTAAPTTTQRTSARSPSTTPPPARKHHRAAAWPTYHANLARTGVDGTSPRLGHLRKAWTTRLDGQVYAEPLAVGGRVYAATENNTVYALSVGTGRVIWSRHLGTPVQASTLPCGNIAPVTGITGTPAISHGTIYAVAFLRGDQHVLFALRLANGSVRFQRSVDAPGADPQVHQERSALSVSRGRVYVPFGGLFSTGSLGGVGGQLDQKKVCDGAFGGLAYKAPLVYVPCTDGLVALRVSGGHFAVAWRGGPDGPPIVAGGAVWSIDTGNGTLEALAAGSGR